MGSGYIESKVGEGSLPAYASDSAGALALNRMGHVVGIDWVQQMVNVGRGFNFTNITPDTLIQSSTSYAATDPSIIMVCPTGTTMIPFRVDISIEDAAGTDNHIIIGFDTADLFTSGGTAGSALNNLRTDSPYTSQLSTAKNGHSAITMVDPTATERIVFHYISAFADATTSPPMEPTWEPKYCPVLVGPATLFVYMYASTAQMYEYNVQWIEIPTTNFTSA